MAIQIQHVHKALRHLTDNDDKEGNSYHLDEAVRTLSDSKSRHSVLKAIGHIRQHDLLEGNSPLVDQASVALSKSLAKG